MILRLSILSALIVSLAGCAAATMRLRQELAPQISTEVAVQVGTEVSIQVGTAIGEQTTLKTAPADPPAAARLPYDCSEKTCGKMDSCEEAVYKLYVCGDSARDSNNDGVPCESMCRGADVPAIATSFAGISPTPIPTSPPGAGEMGLVTRVIDGDTIDVMLNGVNTRVRYLQMNTTERGEVCYREATDANSELVLGKTVRLVADQEKVDRYDRLLRFIYVGDVLVNRVLVEQGFAEVVLYPPNDAHYEEFKRLEQEAAAAGRGCHPTGIFDDGSTTR